MATNFQPSPYEPTRLYDAPPIWIDQLFEEGLSTRAMANSIFSPKSLSPTERSTYITRLKDASESGSLVGDIAGVALNPLCWLPFIFSPGASTALSKGARIFADDVRKIPWLQGLHHARELTRGTGFVEAAADGPIRASLGLEMEWHGIVGDAEAKLAQSLTGNPRARHLNRKAARDPQSKKVWAAIKAQIHGLHQTREEVVDAVVPNAYLRKGDNLIQIDNNDHLAELAAEYQRRLARGDHRPINVSINSQGTLNYGFQKADSANGIFEVKFGAREEGDLRRVKAKEKHRAIFNDKVVQSDKLIDATPGAREYVNAVHNALQLRLVRLLGDEESAATLAAAIGNAKGAKVDVRKAVPGLKIDKDKVQRLHRWHSHEKLGWKNDVDGHGTLDLLLHPSVRQGIGPEKLSPEAWAEMVENSFNSRIQSQVFVPIGRPQAYGWNIKASKLEAIPEHLIAKRERGVGGAHVMGKSFRRRESVLGERTRREMEALFPESFDPRNASNKDFLDDWSRMTQEFETAFGESTVRREGWAWADEFDLDNFSTWEAKTRKDYAYAVADPTTDQYLREAQRGALAGGAKQYMQHGVRGDKPKEQFAETDLHQVFAESASKPRGGWAYFDAMDQSLSLMPDQNISETMYNYVLPALWREKRGNHTIVAGLTGLMQSGVKKGMPYLEKLAGGKSEWSQKLLATMNAWADEDPQAIASHLLGETAGYLYSTHLGFNMPATILQMTQGYLHASTFLGAGRYTQAYFGDAAQEMMAYFKARAKLPARISSEQRDQLMKQVFEFPELLGIHGHVFDALDQMALSKYGDEAGRIRFWTQEVPMMPFSWGETMNRLATIHATRRRYGAAGLDVRKLDRNSKEFANFSRDVDDAQTYFNFASSATQTPVGFMKPPLDNPLMRQFLSFAVRAPVEYVDAARRINGGRRTTAFGGDVPWYVADTARLLGISALIYETGKIAGVDLSPGLAADSMLGLVSDRQSLMEEGLRTLPVNVPPAVSLAINTPLGVVQALGGDSQLLRDNVSRLIPAGIGLGKLASVAPELGVPLGLMQKKYAGWSEALPDGRIPMYNWDGSLIEYKKPAEVILQGLGVDLGAHKKGAEIDGWLVKQREEIVAYRQKALMAMSANDMTKLNRLRGEFQQKFQIPLTVSKTQLRAYLKQRNVPRTERMLDSFPSDVRPQIMQALRREHSRMGMNEETWLANETSTRRSATLGRTDSNKLDPGTLDMLRQMLAESEALKQPSERTFK